MKPPITDQPEPLQITVSLEGASYDLQVAGAMRSLLYFCSHNLSEFELERIKQYMTNMMDEMIIEKRDYV